MIKARYLTSRDDISSVIGVRGLIEEFGGMGRDEYDDMAVYALAFDENGVACGCGRLYIDADSRFRIDTLGVIKQMRGFGVGDMLARMLLYRATDLNAASIRALAPKETAPFFERYGFIEEDHGTSEACIPLVVCSDKLRLEGACSRAKSGCNGDCAKCQNN